jgi:micrococcal nuclease
LVPLVATSAVAGFLAGCTGGEETEEKAASRGTTEETTSPREATEGTAFEFSVGHRSTDEDEGRFDAVTTVRRVVDGDTVDIAPAVEGRDRVRLIGVDTPEMRDPDCGEQPYADEAKAFTTSELEGEEVELEFDEERTDRNDRLLAYVYPRDEEEMFNETLLQEGYAQVATFPPNVKYVDRFLAAQEEARTAGRGLWGLSDEELVAQTDRGNGIGGGGCAAEATPSQPAPQPPAPEKSAPEILPASIEEQGCRFFTQSEWVDATPEERDFIQQCDRAIRSAPAPQPAPQPQPATQPQPASAAPPGGDVDCADFGSSAEAMPYLLPGDPHRLDGDNDGIPCE